MSPEISVTLVVIGLLLLPGCKKPNNVPDTPVVPLYTPVGFAGGSSTLWSNAEDQDGDSVAIRFDWGDGDTSDWSPYFPGGAWMSMTHSWSSAGIFTVTAQAKDERGATSTWSGGRDVLVIQGWARTFGRTGADVGASVQQTQDGGYVVTGLVFSQGGTVTDVWLIKTDAAGNKAWDRTFGGIGPDWGNSVQQTEDGGYIIAGGTGSYGAGIYDVWLIKTDQNGNRVWDKTYGGTDVDEGNSVQQTTDGGYIIVGSTRSHGSRWDDAWLIKTDANGDTVWTRTYGGADVDIGYSVQQTQDGGYVVAGNTSSFGASGTDVWLLKTDAHGDTVWTRTHGGSGTDYGSSVQQTQDGGYIITGYAGRHAWLIKTNANGDTVWTRVFGGTELDAGNSVQQTLDGGYIITGDTRSFGAGSEDVWLIRVDPEGKVSGKLRGHNTK